MNGWKLERLRADWVGTHFEWGLTLRNEAKSAELHYDPYEHNTWWLTLRLNNEYDGGGRYNDLTAAIQRAEAHCS